jgi:hypothetical protein
LVSFYLLIIIIIVIATIVITVITPSGIAPSAFVVRWHHILEHLLLGPSDRRADLQPLRALPPRASNSAAANGTTSVPVTRLPPLDFVFLPRSDESRPREMKVKMIGEKEL